jgi:type I restriction enzyme R subunit
LELEDKEKADYKIKAKQFVKIYGQMASILPFEVADWEKLFWFLKFLIPKMIIKDPQQDLLDELLNSVDLSTYELKRIKLNETIMLDANEYELDPQNPNPRGAHGSDKDEDPLDQIINRFNERWFQGWEATPEDQRIKMLNLKNKMMAHQDFVPKELENLDFQTRDLAFKKILDEVMAKQRKGDMDMYKLYVQDHSCFQALMDTMKRMTGV